MALLGSIIGGVASIAGAAIGAKANADAANAANMATYDAMRISTDAINKYISALYEGLSIQQAAIQSGYTSSVASFEEGSKGAEEVLGGLRDEAKPGLTFFKNLIANPMSLTPEQMYERDEARRINAQNIRSSGFAGSGRTASSLLRKVDTDLTMKMLEANRDRAFQAAGALADSYDTSVRGIAGLKSATGAFKADAADRAAGRVTDMYRGYYSDLGGAYKDVGNVQASGTQQIGATSANAMTANGALAGKAIGEIGSVIASANKPTSYSNAALSAKYPEGAGPW